MSAAMPADRLVTMADIARAADVRLSTVSNWRRRHVSFPPPIRRDGQEIFVYEQVLAWLDQRRIASNDLRAGESPGETYGGRVRRGESSSEQVLTEPAEDAERWRSVLWKGLDRVRGELDLSSFTDLVLGMIYLTACHGERWDALVLATRTAGFPEFANAVDEAVPALPPRWVSSLTGISRPRLGEMVELIDHAVRRRGREAAAALFDDLVERFAVTSGRYGDVLTPRPLLRLLVELLAPKPGDRVLDPCLETGISLLCVADYVRQQGDRLARCAGQAIGNRSRSIAAMCTDLHGLEVDLSASVGLALTEDGHAGQRFDAVLANPPFNLAYTTGVESSERTWPFGSPPASNANFAWLQHIWSSLAGDGRAAVVMANGALSSAQPREAAVRAAMVDAGAVECLVALPPQLFASTAIPVTVWLLRGAELAVDEEILFVDARRAGRMVSRSRRELAPEDSLSVTDSVVRWRARKVASGYHDVPGFRRSVPVGEVRRHGYDLPPGRYVGAPDVVAVPGGRSLDELRSELTTLARRAAEADSSVDFQLDRIIEWTP